MTRFTRKDAEDFYSEHYGKGFFDPLVAQMCSELIVAIELCGKDVIS